LTLALAVAAALASAICAAVSQVMQHRTAGRGPSGSGLHLGLLWHLLRQPVWLVGLLAAGGALVFHAVALGGAQLGIVQPILVSALLFALPASAIIEGRRPSVAEWLWAALLVVGLGVFLVIARPSDGVAIPAPGPVIGALGGAAVVGAVAVLAGATFASRRRAALLGLATGVAYGMVAPLIKIVLAQATTSSALPWIGFSIAALVVLGVVAIVLNQAAYQAGPLAASLPPLTLTDPLIATLIGVVAFGNRIEASPAAIVGEVLSALAVAVAVSQLARRTSLSPSTKGVRPASTPLKGTL
jgi:drug/metabolite transporter (DMT)-like permease